MTEEPAADAGRWMARRLRDAVRRRGTATLAVSGGGSAPPMFEVLLAQDVPWHDVIVWQVDERVAPDGHPERNARQLVDFPCPVELMPVTDDDLAAGAARYAGGLPERFDVVHLGLGDDGHTASWPPGDPVVDSSNGCEVIGEFNGFRRMTLTPPIVNAAPIAADAHVRRIEGTDSAALVPARRDAAGRPAPAYAHLGGARQRCRRRSARSVVAIGSAVMDTAADPRSFLAELPRPARLRDLFANDPGTRRALCGRRRRSAHRLFEASHRRHGARRARSRWPNGQASRLAEMRCSRASTSTSPRTVR